MHNLIFVKEGLLFFAQTSRKKDFPMGQKGSSNMRMEWELGRGEFSNVTCDINMIYDKTRFPQKLACLNVCPQRPRLEFRLSGGGKSNFLCYFHGGVAK